jgi:SNF2 family DNA or RNA helicase
MSIDYYQEKRLEIIRKRKLEREVEASKTDTSSNELNKIDPPDNHGTELLDQKRKHRDLESSMKHDSDVLKKKKEKELADEYWDERQKALKSTKVTHVSADDYLKQFLASRSLSSKKQDTECKPLSSTLDRLHTPGKWNTTTTSNCDQNRLSASISSNVTGSTFMTMSSPSILGNTINTTHAHPFNPSTSKEDPLAKQLAFLARRKKERLAAAGAAANSTLAPTPLKDTYIEKGNCEQNHNKDSNIRESNHDSSNDKHNSDEEEDLNICLYEYSKRQRRKAKLEKHKRDSYTSDSSSQSSQDDNYTGKSSHGLQSLSSNVRDDMNHESLTKSMGSKVIPVHNNESLWSDSDQSDIEKVATERSTNAAKTDMNDGSNNGATRRGTKRRQVKTLISQVESDEEEPFDSDETLLQDLKPNFENPTFDVGELEPFVLDRLVYDNDELGQENEEEVQTHQIPASIARYIQPYQKEGIEFMYQSVIRRKGCILGHDMGLGKTVQLIALLSALQEKTGTKLDLKHITERRKAIVNEEVKSTEQSRKALLYGGSIAISQSKTSTSCNESKTFGPVLIIVPSSVLKNWNNEFQTWGHFAVSTYYGADKSNALNRIKTGFDDILLCGKPTVQSERGIEELLLIPWELVVVDEFHDYKSHTSQSYKSLFEIRNRYHCPILGMTGTLMSNNHKELWTLVDLVRPGHLDSWTVFRREYERPIQLSRVKGARPDAIRLGKERSKELHDALRDVYQKREKSIVLEDFLPTKHQVVMFCTPTDIQKRIYQHILQLPEYELLRKSNAPCDCGVNQAFFTNYASLTNR